MGLSRRCREREWEGGVGRFGGYNERRVDGRMMGIDRSLIAFFLCCLLLVFYDIQHSRIWVLWEQGLEVADVWNFELRDLGYLLPDGIP